LTKNRLVPKIPFFTEGVRGMSDKKNIKPLGNRVLVKRSEARVSKGGIILPETAKQKPKQGEVLAVGPGKLDTKGRLQPLNVRVGDKVLFSNYAGTEMQHDEAAEHLIMSEDDILGILVETK
jgi:chaperonin GroES